MTAGFVASSARQQFLALFVLLLPGILTALQCDIGWNQPNLQEIPQDWINDGYCDCPLDGADEPNTDACSGSPIWPGISRNTLR